MPVPPKITGAPYSDIPNWSWNEKEKFAPKDTKNQLGQEDFLKLMTTQLQNQDPFAPVDNADFIAQMAQFSTVTGITSMDETMKSVSEQLTEMRIASTTQMMGHSVLVPGKYARPDKEGVVSGLVDLPDTAANLNIIFESSDGEVLHLLDQAHVSLLSKTFLALVLSVSLSLNSLQSTNNFNLLMESSVPEERGMIVSFVELIVRGHHMVLLLILIQ
jgi:hypothetical protein